jgi:hypothetical protein
MMEKK